MGLKDLFGKKGKEKAPRGADNDTPDTQQAGAPAIVTADTTDTVITHEQQKKWSSILLAPGMFGSFPYTSPFSLEFAAQSESKLKYFFALTMEYNGVTFPIHAVTFDRREDFSVVLHSMPNIQGAPMGFTGQEKAFRSPALIVLPRTAAEGDFNHIERQLIHVSWRLETYCFSLAVPDTENGGHCVEKFEWRRKPGETEDKKIDRRLVRMRTTTAAEEDVVCRWIGVPWWRKRDSNVVGTMTFSGAGATGELGNKWVLMVVLSNLRIVNEDMHWNEMGAVLKSGGGIAAKAASLAIKIGVEVAMNV